MAEIRTFQSTSGSSRPSRREMWRLFCEDKSLREDHQITDHEMALLERTASSENSTPCRTCFLCSTPSVARLPLILRRPAQRVDGTIASSGPRASRCGGSPGRCD